MISLVDTCKNDIKVNEVWLDRIRNKNEIIKGFREPFPGRVMMNCTVVVDTTTGDLIRIDPICRGQR